MRKLTNVLVDCDGGWNLRPEASVLDRRHVLLRVAIDVHMQHHTAERSAQVVRQRLVREASTRTRNY